MAPARRTADCREQQIEPMHRNGEAGTYPESLWVVPIDVKIGVWPVIDAGIPHLL